MAPRHCAAAIIAYRRGRLSLMSTMWLPRCSPWAASPAASERASSANSLQVQVCQMPRSFSRMAGRAPRTFAWCMSSFGNVSSPESSSAIPSSRVCTGRRIL
jgi:hypothetical protein